MNKQIFVAVLIIALVTSTYAGCAERSENNKDDILEDVKCGLSSAKDKVQEGFSTVVSSDTVQNSYSYLKNKTAGAADVVSDVASKTGGFLSSLWEKGKEKFGEAKEAISGNNKKATTGEDVVDVRQFDQIVTNAP